MIAMPDPSHVRGAAVAPGGAGRRRACSATSSRPSARPTRATRATCCAARWSAPRRWASTRSTSAPSSSTSTSATSNGDRGARRGRLLRPHDARRRLRRAPRDRAGARAARHPRRVLPPRGRPVPARDRHALRRRAEDGRRLHDLPHHGQGVRDEVRLARDVHAQAAVRRERLGHAHAPVAVQGRPQRVLRRRRPVLPLGRPARRSSPASSSTRARSARSSPSGSTPTSGWCPGYEAPVYVAWSRRNRSRARARAALPPRQGAGHAHGAALPRPGVQPVPDVRGAAAGRPGGHREGLRAARADGEEPLPPVRPTSASGSASSSCPRRWARRSS